MALSSASIKATSSSVSVSTKSIVCQSPNTENRSPKLKLDCSSILLPKIQLFEIDPSSTCSELNDSVDMITNIFQGPGEPDKNQVLKLIRKRFFRLFVLKKDDLPKGKSIAGLIVISSFGFKNVVHLEYTIIDDIFQGKGLGLLIMQSLISFLKAETKSLDNYPKFLTLECEEKLMPFYSRTTCEDSELSPLPCHAEKFGKKLIILYRWMEAQLSEERYFMSRSIMERYREHLIGRLMSIRNFLK